MRTDFYYDSRGGGQIHACRWMPDGEPIGVVQIVHGLAEYADRYEEFAHYLTWLGYLVVAEDHMGHGRSIGEESPKGYFNGGWFAAVDDTYQLLSDTMREYPNLPYVLFGHSMGSLMVRTLIAKYPQSGISAVIICGTGWMPGAVISAGKLTADLVCRKNGDRTPSKRLNSLFFSGYNKKVEHPRTKSDWLSRDKRIVDAYEADPLCGYIPAAGLLRDMLIGGQYIQNSRHLENMEKNLPVYFIAGGDDPAGNYGEGVRRAAREFRKHGMKHVSVRIYPLCRHEILNEINREDVFDDISQWIESVT